MDRGRDMLSALAVPMLAQAVLAFSPPIDRPMTVRFSDVRADNGRTLRFDTMRRITFRRADDGVTAEVETIAVEEDAKRAGTMFAAMMRASIGRRIVFRLGPTGAVTDVVDLDTHWTAYVDGIAAAFTALDPTSPQARVIGQIVAARRAAPRVQRIATFAEMLSPLVAGSLPSVPGDRAVTIPGRAHDGSAVTLTGTDRTVANADGTLELDRNVRGTIGGLATVLSLKRRVDPRSGLIRESVERLATDTPTGPATVTRTVVIQPPVF